MPKMSLFVVHPVYSIVVPSSRL